MGVWTPGPGATAGDDIYVGDGTAETVAGLGGNDTLDGGGGLDALDGGDGDDVLVVANTTVLAGESYIGGTGTDTLRLSGVIDNQLFDFFEATVSGVERVEFVSTIGEFSNAVFSSAQLGAGLSSSARFTGSSLFDFVTILMEQPGAISVAGFTFLNWGASDVVEIQGSGGADTVTGSSQSDSMFGLDGADTLSGGGNGDSLSGGAGTDSLFGGDGDDALQGGQDADLLLGNIGDDRLEGGAGADVLGGGAGVDTAFYFFSSTGVTVDLEAGTGLGGDAQGDTLTSIEIVTGSTHNDVLSGRDFIADRLNGVGGDDLLMGRYGGDVLDGGAGIDTLSYVNSLTGVDVRLFSGAASGGEANGDSISGFENIIGSATGTDTLAGDANANQIWGGGGNETITGRENTDTLHGEAGNDTLLGGADSDVLIGGIGADTLGGGSQDDTADYSASDAGVTVNLQTGAGLGGHAQGDVLVSIEDVIGSAFADVIVGKNNVWDNVFDGRGGNDTYTGGLGNDVFVFRLNEGADTITDFVAGGIVDAVQLVGFGASFDSFGEIIAAATQIGADTVIDFGAGQTLTLQNVTLANLSSGDFIFGP